MIIYFFAFLFSSEDNFITNQIKKNHLNLI